MLGTMYYDFCLADEALRGGKACPKTVGQLSQESNPGRNLILPACTTFAVYGIKAK